jgi:hypothetical protein
MVLSTSIELNDFPLVDHGVVDSFTSKIVDVRQDTPDSSPFLSYRLALPSTDGLRLFLQRPASTNFAARILPHAIRRAST